MNVLLVEDYFMKIKKLLLTVVCVLSVASVCADGNNELNETISKEEKSRNLSCANENEALNFLKVYEEKIKNLSEKIQKQEEVVKASQHKICELIDIYIEAVKNELKNKKGEELSAQEIRNIVNECKKNYFDCLGFFGKKETPDKKFFFGPKFFENCPEEYVDTIAILKFYISKLMIDGTILKIFLDQWEELMFGPKKIENL